MWRLTGIGGKASAAGKAGDPNHHVETDPHHHPGNRHGQSSDLQPHFDHRGDHHGGSPVPHGTASTGRRLCPNSETLSEPREWLYMEAKNVHDL